MDSGRGHSRKATSLYSFDMTRAGGAVEGFGVWLALSAFTVTLFLPSTRLRGSLLVWLLSLEARTALRFAAKARLMAEKNGFPHKREAGESIILGEQHRRCGAVCLGDDPEPGAVVGIVCRQNSQALGQRPVVGETVILGEAPPVTCLVPTYPRENVVLGDGLQGIRGGDNPAEAENGYGK